MSNLQTISDPDRESIWGQLTRKKAYVGKFMTDVDRIMGESPEDRTRITAMLWDGETLTLVGENWTFSAHRSVLGVVAGGLYCPAIGMGVNFSDE